jgi:hypothetical protein
MTTNRTNPTKPTTCTVASADGSARCYRPAVHVFAGPNGEQYAECEAHQGATIIT